jgi:3-phenylpropionate/trans-cinnamate dioxygenase ferredoxin component
MDNMPVEKMPETGLISDFEPPWYYAAEESSLKEGKLLHVEPAGRNVLLLKAGEQIHAFSNLCPHARCPMDKGRLEDFVLTCPCHGRRFDVRTGECLNDFLKLRRYEAKSEGGLIGVKLE